jgi:hypothetical protein
MYMRIAKNYTILRRMMRKMILLKKNIRTRKKKMSMTDWGE